MNDTSNTEEITAFVDGEQFDPNALAEVLSTSDGRELLIDLIALRHLVTDDGVYDVKLAPRPSSAWRKTLAAAAAIAIAVGGGYFAGRAATDAPALAGTTTTGSAPSAEAPAPTRVIELRPGVEWKSAGENR